MQQKYLKINQLQINFIMIFVIKSSSKPYWIFLNNNKLIFKNYMTKTYFMLKF